MRKDTTGNSGTTFCSSPLQHWGVDVRVNGEHVLTIESNCLSGRELSDVDELAIRTAAQHLLAFVGDESREVFTIDQCASICKVAPRTASKWFDSGRLKGYCIPGSQDRRVPQEYLVKFMQQHGLPIPEELKSEDADAEPSA